MRCAENSSLKSSLLTRVTGPHPHGVRPATRWPSAYPAAWLAPRSALCGGSNGPSSSSCLVASSGHSIPTLGGCPLLVKFNATRVPSSAAFLQTSRSLQKNRHIYHTTCPLSLRIEMVTTSAAAGNFASTSLLCTCQAVAHPPKRSAPRPFLHRSLGNLRFRLRIRHLDAENEGHVVDGVACIYMCSLSPNRDAMNSTRPTMLGSSSPSVHIHRSHDSDTALQPFFFHF